MNEWIFFAYDVFLGGGQCKMLFERPELDRDFFFQRHFANNLIQKRAFNVSVFYVSVYFILSLGAVSFQFYRNSLFSSLFSQIRPEMEQKKKPEQFQ